MATAESCGAGEPYESISACVRDARRLIYPIVLSARLWRGRHHLHLGGPRFGGMLSQHGDQMPAMSRWTIATGVWLSEHVGLVGLVLLALVLGVRAIALRPGVREAVQENTARLPVLGEWLVEAEVGRWASTFGPVVGR